MGHGTGRMRAFKQAPQSDQRRRTPTAARDEHPGLPPPAVSEEQTVEAVNDGDEGQKAGRRRAIERQGRGSEEEKAAGRRRGQGFRRAASETQSRSR